MISYNLEFLLRKSTDGYKIYLKYTINKKRKFVSTGYELKSDKLWDKKNQRVRETHADYETINTDLQARKQNIASVIIDAQIKGSQTVNLSKVNHGNLFSFVEEWIKEVTPNRSSQTIENYHKHLRKLKLFAGEELTFEAIDQSFLGRYEAYIRAGNRKDNSTYITAIWRTLKKWFNVARKRGITTNYPFDNYENPACNPDDKDYLTFQELKLWEEQAESLTGDKRMVAYYYLLGCYSGLRISDLFLFDASKNVEGDQLRLRANKNKERVAMKIQGPLKRVLKIIGSSRLTIAEQTGNEKLKAIAKDLKINKHITWHTARKCFAVTMCADRGISSETCATLMGITISTCVESYYRVTSVKIDKETSLAWAGI